MEGFSPLHFTSSEPRGHDPLDLDDGIPHEPLRVRVGLATVKAELRRPELQGFLRVHVFSYDETRETFVVPGRVLQVSMSQVHFGGGTFVV